MIASICAPAPDFNPRSYKRSDCYYSYTAPFMDISIHAPTRGATGLHPLFISVMRISIHAPTRGATLGGNMDNMIGQNFNPRSYKRSDHFLPKRLQDIYNFNPRSYKRSDLITNKQACAVSDFNPRSYKRSDFITGAFSHDYKDFNPRSYKRSDLSDLPPFAPPDISIHAPTRGATPSVPIDVSICSISIHAPTRGATASTHQIFLLPDYFNPRSYKRSDVIGLEHLAKWQKISIHAPTRGATVQNYSKIAPQFISIHAPTRGATIHSVMFYSKNTFQSTLLQEERQDHRLRSFCRK